MIALLVAGVTAQAADNSFEWLAKLPVKTTTTEDSVTNLGFDANSHNWLIDHVRALATQPSADSQAGQPPYIMLAGYYNTDVTSADGGTFTMIAYVMDPEGQQDISQVELYYGGTATGVMLADDGTQGDFGAGDQVYGLTVPIAPGVLPAGSYTLELVATDLSGNQSDMWPYLTVHP